MKSVYCVTYDCHAMQNTYDRALLGGSDMFRQAQRAREGPFAGGTYDPDAEMDGPNVSWDVHPP